MNKKVLKIINSNFTMPFIIMGIRASSLVLKFVLTLFIAKFISFEALGFYGLITGASILIPVFASLSIIYMINRRAITMAPEEIIKELYHYATYLLLIYASLFCIFIIIGISTDNVSLLLIILSVIFLEHINNDAYNLLLNRSLMLGANLLHFLRSGFWILIYVVSAFFYEPYRDIFVLLIFWQIGCIASLIGFFYLTKNWPWLVKQRNMNLWQWLKQEFKLSKTIYINSLMHSSSQYIDRYLLTFFLDLKMAGVYIFFWSIYSALCNLLRTGVIQMARPKLVKLYKNCDRDSYHKVIKESVNKTLIFASLSAFLTGVSIYAIMPYINRPLAVEWFPILWLLLFGFVICMVSEIVGLIFYSQHRDDLTLKASSVFLFTSFSFNIVFIPIWGLWGAAISLILSMIAGLIVQYKMAKKILN